MTDEELPDESAPEELDTFPQFLGDLDEDDREIPEDQIFTTPLYDPEVEGVTPLDES